MKEGHRFGDIFCDLQSKRPVEEMFAVGDKGQQILVLYKLGHDTKRLRAESFELDDIRMIQPTNLV